MAPMMRPPTMCATTVAAPGRTRGAITSAGITTGTAAAATTTARPTPSGAPGVAALRGPCGYHTASMRLAGLSVALVGIAVVALVVNYLGAAGGHCDDSCSGNFPFWLYVASGWVVILSVVLLLVIAAVALVRRLRAS